MIETGEKPPRLLLYGPNDVPPWKTTVLLAFQQVALTATGMIVFPFIVANAVCAGDATVSIRVQLIAGTYLTAGLATVLQCLIGLRLAIMQGTAITFLPPILAWSALPANKCNTPLNVTVPVEVWQDNLQTLGGSMAVACVFFLLIGSTGVVGYFSKFVGPITVVPVFLLLVVTTIPSMESDLAEHWIGIVMVVAVIINFVYLEKVHVPIPIWSEGRLQTIRMPIFQQFPYLISLGSTWFLCFLLTITGAEPPEGPARTDKAADVKEIQQAPWINVPYPAWFGYPSVDSGLMLGFMAACISNVVENLGTYDMAARVSEQSRPPEDAVNRAMIIEGLGSILAGMMGCGVGITSYSKNVALMSVTGVASRICVVLTGVILIGLGLFTKAAAILASIPDPLVGGVLCMGMSMVFGVAITNLKMVDLRVNRNLTILGLALVIGMVVPYHFEQHPLDTGDDETDGLLNIILTIRTLVGGVVAFVLDNTVPGASRFQRGFRDRQDEEPAFTSDGYDFPVWFTNILRKHLWMTYIPIFPSSAQVNKIVTVGMPKPMPHSPR